jgi:hypothetical protein
MTPDSDPKVQEELLLALEKLDRDLVNLVEKRRAISSSLGRALPLPNVESAVARANGSVSTDALGEILSLVHRRTAPLSAANPVSVFGATDGPTYHAVMRAFGGAASLRSFDSVEACLKDVRAGQASLAVLPFETAPYGPEETTLRGLLQCDLRIVATFQETPQGGHPTRYALIAERAVGRTGDDLTALVFTLKDAPGALKEVLQCLAAREVNICKIESRTGPADGVYYFFVECRGHASDRNLVPALDELRKLTQSCKVLGSYPSANFGVR